MRIKEKEKENIKLLNSKPETMQPEIIDNNFEYYKNRVYETIEEYKTRYNYTDAEIEGMKQLKWNSVLIYISDHVYLSNNSVGLIYDSIS